MALMPISGGGGDPGITFAAGSTNVFILGVGDLNFIGGASESGRSRQVQFVGTFTSVSAYITVNGTPGGTNSTLKTRYNAADGAMSVTYDGGTTGLIEQTSGTDTTAVNDTEAISTVIGAGGTGQKSSQVTLCQNPTNQNLYTTTQGSNLAASGTNSSNFGNVGATRQTTAAGAESAFQQAKIRSAATIKNYWMDTVTNTRVAGSVDFYDRVNGARPSSPLDVNVTFGATGRFSDYTHSSVVVAGDLLCREGAADGSSGTCSMQSLTWDAVSTVQQSDCIAALTIATVTLAAGTTYFNAYQSRISQDTTEADRAVKTRVAGIARLHEVYMSANSITGASTITSRKTGGAGNISIPIPGSATFSAGWFEDTSGSDVYTAADTINWQSAMGAGGTTGVMDYMILQYCAMWGTVRRQASTRTGSRS